MLATLFPFASVAAFREPELEQRPSRLLTRASQKEGNGMHCTCAIPQAYGSPVFPFFFFCLACEKNTFTHPHRDVHFISSVCLPDAP